MRHSEGRSPANLDLLQEVVGTLLQLDGPWVIGWDFNFTPDALQESGWLQLVQGVIHRPVLPTCNGKVYDFFVSSRDMAEAVVGVAVVRGTGLHPHSPSRIFLRRK